jgi:hypothetical protein
MHAHIFRTDITMSYLGEFKAILNILLINKIFLYSLYKEFEFRIFFMETIEWKTINSLYRDLHYIKFQRRARQRILNQFPTRKRKHNKTNNQVERHC